MRARFPVRHVIRRAGAVIAAAVAALVVALAASGCGSTAASGAAATEATATNGLQNKAPDQVIHEAAAALRAARSVQLTETPAPPGPGPYQMATMQVQGDATIALFTEGGRPQFKMAVAGRRAYIQFSTAGMRLPYWLSPLRRVIAGRWFTLSMSQRDIRGISGLQARIAGQLAGGGPSVTSVSQATLNGRKVVVVSDPEGGKLYVANTGPAYPLLVTVPGGGKRISFSRYGANFHVPTPREALPGGPSYTGPALA
jgi:hypothetical protein